MQSNDPFGARESLATGFGEVEIYSLKALDERVEADVFSLPFSVRVLLESLLRNCGGKFVSEEDVEALASWPESVGGELAYLPARVVMQDFTGVPAVVDLAAMRSAMQQLGGDPAKINPLVPSDLVIDHSVQVDAFGSPAALQFKAEAVMLGQPYYMLVPEVIGFKLTGALREGVTATDLVLTVTQMLRAHGVVGKFVEFYGEGLSRLSLPDRATIANMAPEYGATCSFFPVDAESTKYLLGTGREGELVDLVEAYCKEQGLWRTDETPDPRFSETLELDMDTVESSLAGPRRPQDRLALADVKPAFRQALADMVGPDHPLLTNGKNGHSDPYDEADEESFPASDTPNPDIPVRGAANEYEGEEVVATEGKETDATT